MWIIDEILMLLKDGEWHEIKEIRNRSPLNEFRMDVIIRFLEEYSFVTLDEKRQKAKLHPLMINFVEEVQRLGEEEPVTP